MKIKMYKIFSLMIFSVLWGNSVLHAVGGEAEKISDEESANKGILKIKDTSRKEDNDTIGTAILFKEGKGQLGLGAKHVFQNKKTVAYLGKEERKVARVFTPSDDLIDLALFVLESPFTASEEFPHLPTSAAAHMVLYEGWFYGCGRITPSDLTFPQKNPDGLCRKGKFLTCHVEHIESFVELFSSEKERESTSKSSISLTHKSMLSFFMFPKENSFVTTKNAPLKANATNRVTTMILEKERLPLRDSYSLTPSPCFALPGDSGGPLISEDNQLYAIVSSGKSRYKNNIEILTPNIVIEKQYKEVYSDTTGISCGFINEEDSLYMGSKFKGKFQELCIEATAANWEEGLVDYHLGYKNNIFYNITEKEKQSLPATPYVTQWMKQNYIYHRDSFESIICNQAWIEKAMSAATNYIEKNLTSSASKQ